MVQLKEVLSEFFSVEEVKVYDEIISLFKSPLPSGKNHPDYYPYVNTNLQLQNWLNQKRVEFDYVYTVKRTEVFSIEAGIRADLKDEGIRSTEERTVFCYKNSKYAQKREELDNYQLISEHLKSLEWSLKSALSSL